MQHHSGFLSQIHSEHRAIDFWELEVGENWKFTKRIHIWCIYCALFKQMLQFYFLHLSAHLQTFVNFMW
jgi:hypothetical protein